MLSRDQLQRAAADGGLQMESYEKVHMLIDLLESMRAHPFLGPRMALKGGTALNLFVPRLSSAVRGHCQLLQTDSRRLSEVRPSTSLPNPDATRCLQGV